jgi:hypothetical protein
MGTVRKLRALAQPQKKIRRWINKGSVGKGIYPFLQA